ncbi:MAG: hypothetical protein IH968_05860 [Gemmatimonadetes bacterium]|nr:hypothetical protein [Gemmatimonadota bacterium]
MLVARVLVLRGDARERARDAYGGGAGGGWRIVSNGQLPDYYFPRVVASTNGNLGLILLNVDRRSLERREGFFSLEFDAQLGSERTAIDINAIVDNLWYKMFDPSQYVEKDVSREEAAVELAIAALGWRLDHGGPELPEYADGVAVAPQVSEMDERGPAEDEEIYKYLASHCYWSHVHRRPSFSVHPCDLIRLGVPEAEFLHVAHAFEGEDFTSWVSGHWRPTKGLLRKFREGLPVEVEGKPVLLPATFLDRRKYEEAATHLQKAHAFLFEDEIDLENAVKEAISAVESVALRAAGRTSGTLGDAIGDLRKQGGIPAELLKALENVWTFANRASGVRHGKPGPARAVTLADARAVISMASAMLLRLVDELE